LLLLVALHAPIRLPAFFNNIEVQSFLEEKEEEEDNIDLKWLTFPFVAAVERQRRLVSSVEELR